MAILLADTEPTQSADGDNRTSASSTLIPTQVRFYSPGNPVTWADSTDTATSAWNTWAWNNTVGTATNTSTFTTTTFAWADSISWPTTNTFTWTVDAGGGIPEFNAQVLKRAEKLLKGMLTSKQRRTWEKFRYIVIPSRTRPGLVYKLPASGMIRMIQDGRPVSDLCVHPAERLPVGDKIAALKLFVEVEEDELHRIANVHAIRQPALV